MPGKSIYSFIGCYILIVSFNVAAQSSVVIAITNPNETDKIANDSVVSSASLVLIDSSASGYANLDTGILRSKSTGPVAQPGSGFPDAQFSSQAAAQITDSITFASGFSGTGYLDWKFEGTLTAFAPPVHSATAALVINIGATGENIYLADNPSFCAPGQSFCTTGTSINQTGTIPFQISPGTLQVSAFLQTVAFDGAAADFSNTGRLYLRLPTGITYTSNSGTFLADAQAILPSVPEPATYSLLLVGLSCAACLKSRLSMVRQRALAARKSCADA